MIPLCYKCSDKIIKEYDSGMAMLIGCKGNENIKTYADAMVLCPLTHEPEPHKTVPLKITPSPD